MRIERHIRKFQGNSLDTKGDSKVNPTQDIAETENYSAMSISRIKPLICSPLVTHIPNQNIHDSRLSPPPGCATESGAQSQETEQNPRSQSSGAVSGKSVTFAKVIKIITIGDEVD